MKKSNIVLLITLGALLALLLVFTITAGSAVRRALEETDGRSSALFDPAPRLDPSRGVGGWQYSLPGRMV